MLIKLSTLLRWPIERQIPTSFERNGIHFVINDSVERCDAWVVYQGLYRPDVTICPPERLIFFSYEPPDFHSYNGRFLSQFSKVITCHRSIVHPGLILRHQAQPWLVGTKRNRLNSAHESYSYDYRFEDFAAEQFPQKFKTLSTVTSSRLDSLGHARRIALLSQLQSDPAIQLDIFGFGRTPIEDKFEALLPYQFHLVLENTTIEDYWTEKLADCYLGYCFPIVWGCKNLQRYFPEDSFVLLDPDKPELAAATVTKTLAEGITDKRRAAIREARSRVLYNYNLFSEIVDLCRTISTSEPRRVCLRDESCFSGNRLFRLAGRILRDVVSPETHDYYMNGGWRHTRHVSQKASPTRERSNATPNE